MKTEITKELIESIISSTHEEITIEDIYTSIRMRDYIYDHLEYFKTQKFSMVDVTAGFVVAVKQLIKEVEEYNNLSIVCDETNNTPETMNQNELIIDVYVNRQCKNGLYEVIYESKKYYIAKRNLDETTV